MLMGIPPQGVYNQNTVIKVAIFNHAKISCRR